jgi:hypothetical protein
MFTTAEPNTVCSNEMEMYCLQQCGDGSLLPDYKGNSAGHFRACGTASLCLNRTSVLTAVKERELLELTPFCFQIITTYSCQYA